MTCDQIQEKMHDYLDGDLSSEMRAQIEAHLDDCPACKEAYSDLKEVLQLLKELPIEPLPENFEATLHEALERESKAIRQTVQNKVSPLRQRFKKWQRGLSYAAAVFLVGVVGLSGMDGFSSLLQNQSKMSDEATVEMASDSGVRSGAPELMAKSEDVNFSESLSAVAPEEAPVDAPVDTPIVSTALAPVEAPAKSDDPFTPQEIKRIYSGQVSLEVTAYDQALNRVTKQVTDLGGYVENQQTGTYNQIIGGKDVLLHEGFVVLRVPAEHFNTVMTSLAGQGKVLNTSQQTSDITAEYRDTYQELKNLQVREASLREIMAKAANVTEIIEVERELSRVRQEINAYGSQLAGWDRMVAHSTIHVNIREVRDTTSAVNPPQAGLFARAREAFVKTVNAIIEGFDRLFVATVGAMPIVLPLLLVSVLGWFAYKRFLKRK